MSSKQAKALRKSLNLHTQERKRQVAGFPTLVAVTCIDPNAAFFITPDGHKMQLVPGITLPTGVQYAGQERAFYQQAKRRQA